MGHVLILGGDGYLGWPTAMHLSKKGWKVTVVDNYFRRNASMRLNIQPLYNNLNLIERAKLWHSLTGLEIKVIIGDLKDEQIMNQFFTGCIKYD